MDEDLLSLEDALEQVFGDIISSDEMTHKDLSVNFLEHFGIKGMKWGVRRNKQQIAGSEDHTRAKALRKKSRFGKTRKLSNDELRIVIERMNLEKQFSDLKKGSGAGKGSKIAEELLIQFGKEQARKALLDASGHVIKNLLKK